MSRWFRLVQGLYKLPGRSLVGKRGFRKVAGSDLAYTDPRQQPGKKRKRRKCNGYFLSTYYVLNIFPRAVSSISTTKLRGTSKLYPFHKQIY